MNNKENIIETVILSDPDVKEKYPFLNYKLNKGISLQNSIEDKATFKKLIIEIINNLKPLNETTKVLEIFKQQFIPVNTTKSFVFTSKNAQNRNFKGSLSNIIFDALISDINKYSELKMEIETILEGIGLKSTSFKIDTNYSTGFITKEINIIAEIIDDEKLINYFGCNSQFLTIPLSFATININIQNKKVKDLSFLSELINLLKKDNLIAK